MVYLVIDGELHGTGLRDYYNGGYVNPESLKLSDPLRAGLSDWLLRYENEHYNGFNNKEKIEELDEEGITIAKKIKEELNPSKISYYSAAKLTTIPI